MSYRQGFELIVFDTPISLEEVSSPTVIEDNTLKIYAKDKSGVSTLYYMGDDEVEMDLGAAALHTLLNASTHTDSVAQTVSRGSLIYGNSTPKWDELTIGANTRILGSDGTDAAWRAQSFIDHGSISGLSDNDHPQYAPINNGFSNYKADSTISFVDGTRTFTAAPTGATFEVWAGGARFLKTSESVVISDVEGIHFVYYDSAGVLTSIATSNDDVELGGDIATVSGLYWDVTNQSAILFCDERHGRDMRFQVHHYLHETRGTAFESGLGLGSFSIDGSGNDAANAQFSVADGVIWDEDLEHDIIDGSPQQLTPAEIPFYYLSGATPVFRKIAATVYAVTTTGSGRAAYNLNTAGTWSLAEVSNTNYVLCHFFATCNKNEPVIGIVGQAQYATLAAARVGADTEINDIVFAGTMLGLVQEFKTVATVIFQTNNGYGNAVKSRIRSLADGSSYVDWRFNIGAGAGGTPVSSHSSLTNLGWTVSGHTGTASRLAAFDGSGVASEIDYSGDWLSQYRLESADHSHQSTGLEAGKIDHGLALDGLGDDDHALYLLASDATNRATFASNWLDLTDGGSSTLHSHPGGSGAHTIRENGVDQTARTGLNFIDTDAGVGLITDDAGNDETEVNLQLFALLSGRSSGQTILGGLASGEQLVLRGSAHTDGGTITINSDTIVNADPSVASINTSCTFTGAGNDPKVFNVQGNFAPSVSIAKVTNFKQIASLRPPGGVTITTGYAAVNQISTTNSGGAITTAVTNEIDAPSFNTLKPTNMYGIEIQNQGSTGVTAATALVIAAQSGAGTNLGIDCAAVIQSTLATGTAPLVITSTTKVANLNCDLLDDQEGSYYLDSGNFTGANWTDLTDGGATTLHKHDHGGMDGLSDNDHPQYLLVTDIDDTPVDGEVAQPISSNWAFDHVAAADPHTPYLLASGGRALSADWDAGSFEIRAQTFESDVATGTPPFVIASATLVSNLRVDGSVFYAPTMGDTGINSAADVTIVTTDLTEVSAGDQIIVEGEFTILNDTTGAKVYVITLDFDAAFDIEITTGSLANSSTIMHPFHFRAVCDIRSTSLAYEVVAVEGQLAAGIASGGDSTMAATHLRGMGWATAGGNLTGTTTIALFIRTTGGTGATQTCRLHSFTVRKVRPT